MFSNPFLQFGDWNPQLFREVKGRFKSRNVLAALVLSLLGQFCLFLHFYRSKFGDASILEYAFLKDDSIQLRLWWFDIFHLLFRFAFLLLMVLGSYLLTEDISGEARRGTLTFLRLSPQSSRSILIGKLLGVPILLYVAIALTIPLQLWAAHSAGLTPLILSVVYLIAGIACCFVYSFVLFYTLNWRAKTQTWFVVVLAGLFSVFLSALWNSWGSDYRHAMSLPGESFILLSTWIVLLFMVLISFGFLSYCFWQKSISRFHRLPDR
jgi:hypothetical protein